MPWQNRTTMSLKLEFVKLADQEESNMSALCRRFSISRPTGYKWLERYREEGAAGLEERSRRPDHSPNKTPDQVQQAVLEVRRNHPTWGGRKIRGRLLQRVKTGGLSCEVHEVPARSTCQAIVKRNGLVNPELEGGHTSFEQFEKDQPNELWQMDFKGHFSLTGGEECHPLTIVDDHSRFALAVEACPNERYETVKGRLEAVFRRYGLPRRILCDNSLPWGVPTSESTGRPLYTKLNAWLFRLGIDVVHGQPYHPQTQGKCERFHRSLQEEVLDYGSRKDLPECQNDFDRWRTVYNQKRPHESLPAENGEMDVPSNQYQISGRPFPEPLPEIIYPSAKHVRTVSAGGQIWFAGDRFYVGEAFDGHPVALRSETPEETPSSTAASRANSDESNWAVFYCHKKVRVIESEPPDH